MNDVRYLAGVSVSFALFLVGPPVVAQNLTEMMLESMVREGASRAEEMLQKAPEKLQEYLAERQQEFETERECISELQLLANAGALASNIMPFSSVWAYEDEGDLRTRLRLVVNGERFHADFSCDGSRLIGASLEWNAPLPPFPEYDVDTLNAALGAFFTQYKRVVLQNEEAEVREQESGPAVSRVGQPMPNLPAVSLSDYSSYSPNLIADEAFFLVNFWSSWNPLSVSEINNLLSLQDEGVLILGVNLRDQESNAQTFLKKHGNPFVAIPFDAVGRSSIEWGVTTSPETFIVDNEGIIRYRFSGPLVGSDYEQRFLPALEEVRNEALQEAFSDALQQATNISDQMPPPLTQAEIEQFRMDVQDCWVVGVGSSAANVTVTIGFDMDPNGRVVSSSIRLLSSVDGSGSDVDDAFQAARRAILRCQGDGYRLPISKYENWKYAEMTFNAESMRIR